jgi:glutamyl-tRNA reductase
MPLFLIGLNHETAPIDVRERYAFVGESLGQELQRLIQQPGIHEASLISTCNRSEWLLVADEHNAVKQALGESLIAEGYIYMHQDQEAAQHLLKVACGLNSLVLGEPQILGQCKQALEAAQQAKTAGPLVTHSFEHAFHCAKRVRTETSIGSHPVSVAFAAVRTAQQIFSNFERHTALLIGAGETGELLARHLAELGLGKLLVTNRTIERAQNLAAEHGSETIAWQDLEQAIPQADIVISSTAAPEPVVQADWVKQALKIRKRRPMFMVDLAVPRDIEPATAELDDVYLYTVDDLQNIAQQGLDARREAAAHAEDIVQIELENWTRWSRERSASDAIRSFRGHAGEATQQELDKAIQALRNGDNAEQVLTEFAHKLSAKLTHAPTTKLREMGAEEQQQSLALIAKLYDENS